MKENLRRIFSPPYDDDRRRMLRTIGTAGIGLAVLGTAACVLPEQTKTETAGGGVTLTDVKEQLQLLGVEYLILKDAIKKDFVVQVKDENTKITFQKRSVAASSGTRLSVTLEFSSKDQVQENITGLVINQVHFVTNKNDLADESNKISQETRLLRIEDANGKENGVYRFDTMTTVNGEARKVFDDEFMTNTTGNVLDEYRLKLFNTFANEALHALGLTDSSS